MMPHMPGGDAVPEVTGEELAHRKEPVLFVDVREPDEYAGGHIPGALLISLGELEKRCGEIPRGRDVILVCRSGRRSELACRFLGRLGYDRVRNLKGGMLAWTGDVER